MKCSVEVNDKVGGFDLTMKLNNLSAIQMSSFYKSFANYVKFINENEENFGSSKEEKELPKLILQEYDKAFRKAIENIEAKESVMT